jgi:hypothetical protein
VIIITIISGGSGGVVSVPIRACNYNKTINFSGLVYLDTTVCFCFNFTFYSLIPSEVKDAGLLVVSIFHCK